MLQIIVLPCVFFLCFLNFPFLVVVVFLVILSSNCTCRLNCMAFPESQSCSAVHLCMDGMLPSLCLSVPYARKCYTCPSRQSL